MRYKVTKNLVSTELAKQHENTKTLVKAADLRFGKVLGLILWKISEHQ